jgi:hypothetical protein
VIRRRLGIATVAFIVVGAPALNAQEERVTDLVPRVVDLVARTSRFGATTTESARRVEIVVAADVLFRFDSWDLTPRARRTLQDAAEQIESKAIGFVRIESCCPAAEPPLCGTHSTGSFVHASRFERSRTANGVQSPPTRNEMGPTIQRVAPRTAEW